MTPKRVLPAARCRRCRKAIVWPGLCYSCATGLPRRLRPATEDEHETPPTGADAARSGPAACVAN